MELGKKQMLTVVKVVDFGVYLGDDREKVLLPKKQVPAGIEPGDPIEVFLYKDSSDRLIATVNEPSSRYTAVYRLLGSFTVAMRDGSEESLIPKNTSIGSARFDSCRNLLLRKKNLFSVISQIYSEINYLYYRKHLFFS